MFSLGIAKMTKTCYNQHLYIVQVERRKRVTVHLFKQPYVYYPYYDELYQRIKYQETYIVAMTDDETYEETLECIEHEWARQNQQNPDWQWLIDPTESQTFDVMDTNTLQEFQIDNRPIGLVGFNLNADAAKQIDYWYGSRVFANFGVAFWGDSVGPWLPPLFLNTLEPRIPGSNQNPTRLYVLTKPFVYGTVTLTPFARMPLACYKYVPSEGDPEYRTLGPPTGTKGQLGRIYTEYLPPLT